ncbi:RNase P modulator RnpM [Tepidiforma sp.]|uniref:RNase P modulator RnpM n=1 Tax=Tepidiforma sp. TaxID=2682230 RepID=UPI003A1035CF
MATGARPRRQPQRTCIACRAEQGKRELVRIVRTPEGRVVVDLTGRANGRGAYIHPTRECWEKALRGGTIKHALRITPAVDDVEALRAFGLALPAKEGDSV